MPPYEKDPNEEWRVTPPHLGVVPAAETSWVLRWRGGQLIARTLSNSQRRVTNAESYEKALQEMYQHGTDWDPGSEVSPEREPFHYHPLIDRPSPKPLMQQELHQPNRIASHTAALSIFKMLETLFSTVHPHPHNAATYGESIRHLLILACTEVEAAWRSTLNANGCKVSRPTTRDFVKLRDPMKLDQRAVTLRMFPDWGEIAPFKKWSGGEPTRSLVWYDAYNAAKHDRTQALSRAALQHAVSAVAAVFLLHIAQFGVDAELVVQQPFLAAFEIAREPAWSALDLYYGFTEEGVPEPAWSAVPLFAQSAP